MQRWFLPFICLCSCIHLSLSLYHSLTCSFSLSITHSYTHTRSFSLSHSLSLSFTHTHTHSLSLSFSLSAHYVHPQTSWPPIASSRTSLRLTCASTRSRKMPDACPREFAVVCCCCCCCYCVVVVVIVLLLLLLCCFYSLLSSLFIILRSDRELIVLLLYSHKQRVGDGPPRTATAAPAADDATASHPAPLTLAAPAQPSARRARHTQVHSTQTVQGCHASDGLACAQQNLEGRHGGQR